MWNRRFLCFSLSLATNWCFYCKQEKWLEIWWEKSHNSPKIVMGEIVVCVTNKASLHGSRKAWLATLFPQTTQKQTQKWQGILHSLYFRPPPPLISLNEKIESFDPKIWVTGGTKIRYGIPKNKWRTFESISLTLSQNIWIKLSQNIWVKLSQNIWVKLSQNIWVKLSQNIWVKLSQNIWVKLSQNIWVKLSQNIWVKLSQNIWVKLNQNIWVKFSQNIWV